MQRKYVLILMLFFLVISLFQFINADIISLNSGGTGNIIINPNEQIEGFFSGEVIAAEVVAVCGNSIIETGETCDDGNTVSGDGCSSTCQTEVVIPPGAGAGGAVTTIVDISVTPTEINLNLAINTARDQVIIVTNLGTTALNVSVSQEGLDNMVILPVDHLVLAGGETKTITARFVAPGIPGIYTGKIKIDGKDISVALNVKTKLLLFDSNIVVLNDNYLVPQNDDLKTRVTLVPLGDPERLDVTLNYVIKDYNNKIYLTKSETLLIDDRVQFNRDFDTGSLPVGKYIIGLELVYPNGVAPSSAHFEVTERPPTDIIGTIILYLVIFILIIAIIILAVLIVRYLKRKKEEAEQGQ